jgi:predicted DsbA family dithiol-disulfide isomerase
MTRFDIKIISDTVCPWCYMGKKRLEAGIAAYRAAHPESQSQDTFSVTWHPFYLDPSAPTKGVDKAQRYRDRFGAERVESMFARMSDMGREVGINFKFGGLTGNTRDSHRLIRYAMLQGGEEVQNRVVDQLFSKYFENEGDITSRDVLREAAVKAGLDGDEVGKFLESGEGTKEVEQEVVEAQLSGVHGVPNIRVNGVLELPGAVEPEIFKQVFEKVKSASP